MAIKTMDASLFDKITNKSENEIEEYESGYLSENDMRYLYEKGLEELEALNDSLKILAKFMSELFCGGAITYTEESINFFTGMEMFIEDLIPAILVGDNLETYKYCSEEITEEELDAARAEFYQILYKKYLER